MWKSLLSNDNRVYIKCWREQYFYLKTSVQLAVVAILFYHFFIDVNSDLFHDTPDFIRKYGYPVESHVVKSEDGYLMTLHRIPFGLKSNSRKNRPIVFLQHGIMCSSDIWVYSGPGTDLPFILAENGYDVWLGNARGNHYADEHVNRSLTKEEYWDFSWHEMGYYDLPAAIDYILNRTNQKDLSYIGHSMGSTMFLVMASEKPEYNEKIRFMIGLGPVATLQHFTTVTQNVLVPAYLGLGNIMKFISTYQLFPRSTLRTYITNFVCKDKMPTQFFCRQLAFGLAGESYEQYNSSAISVILSHVPAGSSQSQVLHFYQNMKKGRFQQRDFGPEENMKRYNQTEPPAYNISKISAPISLYYSDNDMMATVKGVLELAKAIPNLVGLHRVPLKSFNHFDFTWGLNANRLLYDDIVKELRERVQIFREQEYNAHIPKCFNGGSGSGLTVRRGKFSTFDVTAMAVMTPTLIDQEL